jgi:hypothetical protein
MRNPKLATNFSMTLFNYKFVLNNYFSQIYIKNIHEYGTEINELN